LERLTSYAKALQIYRKGNGKSHRAFTEEFNLSRFVFLKGQSCCTLQNCLEKDKSENRKAT
jgi:hypothetical protein